MVKKIFRSILLSSLGLCLGMLCLIMFFLYHYFTQIEIKQLQEQTSLVAQGVEFEGSSYLEKIAVPDVRVTWIQENGEVQYDSEVASAQMENHRSRKEVIEALQDGVGSSIRYSSTLTEQSLYTAQRLTDGSVIRLSLSQGTIFLLLWKMVPWLIVLLLVSIAVSTYTSRITARKLLLPLEELNLEDPLSNDVYAELNPLLKRLNQNQEALVVKEQLLQQKTKEFTTIISKIREGMLILDEQGKLVSYNHSAGELFELDRESIGTSLPSLYRKSSMKSLIETTLSGKKSQDYVAIESVQYKVLGRPIWAEGILSGAVLLFFDETEQQALETMRREFTANVSHELRTPLQIMAGYSEILKNQELTIEALRCSKKIYQETQRMITLVEDILYLSQLDEIKEITREKVNLTVMLQDILNNLKEQANQRDISLSLTGLTVYYWGNKQLLHSIFYNICENAIKYNKEKGSVTVQIQEDANRIFIDIVDTGIGMARKDHSRIFERFFRIDKSRSKKVGGTGLGLSIVKHGLLLHNARITVNSQLGKGTKMSMEFLKSQLK